MATTVAELNARISLDDRQFQQGQRRAQRSLGDLAKGFKNAAAASGTFDKAINAIKFAAVVAGLTAMARAALRFGNEVADAASDVSESVSKINTLFGASGREIDAWSKTTSRALGISRREALEAAGNYGNLFRSMEFGQKTSADMSKRLVQLAADLASFNNTSIQQALDALRSGMVGESEPLRAFGVNINEATIKAQALRDGLIKTEKEGLTPAGKAAATYALILKQTSIAQGDFSRTADGVANRQRILAARADDLRVKFGEAALPLKNQLLRGLLDLMDKVDWRGLLRAFGDVAKSLGDFLRTEGPVFIQWLTDAARRTADLVKAFSNLSPAAKGLSIGGIVAALSAGPAINAATNLTNLIVNMRTIKGVSDTATASLAKQSEALEQVRKHFANAATGSSVLAASTASTGKTLASFGGAAAASADKVKFLSLQIPTITAALSRVVPAAGSAGTAIGAALTNPITAAIAFIVGGIGYAVYRLWNLKKEVASFMEENAVSFGPTTGAKGAALRGTADGYRARAAGARKDLQGVESEIAALEAFKADKKHPVRAAGVTPERMEALYAKKKQLETFIASQERSANRYGLKFLNQSLAAGSPMPGKPGPKPPGPEKPPVFSVPGSGGGGGTKSGPDEKRIGFHNPWDSFINFFTGPFEGFAEKVAEQRKAAGDELARLREEFLTARYGEDSAQVIEARYPFLGKDFARRLAANIKAYRDQMAALRDVPAASPFGDLDLVEAFGESGMGQRLKRLVEAQQEANLEGQKAAAVTDAQRTSLELLGRSYESLSRLERERIDTLVATRALNRGRGLKDPAEGAVVVTRAQEYALAIGNAAKGAARSVEDALAQAFVNGRGLKDAVQGFWQTFVFNGTKSLLSMAWQDLLQPKLQGLFASLAEGLNGSLSGIVQAAGSILNGAYALISMMSGGRRKRGGLFGALLGAGIAIATGGWGAALTGLSIGSSVGSALGSGDFGQILFAGLSGAASLGAIRLPNVATGGAVVVPGTAPPGTTPGSWGGGFGSAGSVGAPLGGRSVVVNQPGWTVYEASDAAQVADQTARSIERRLLY